MRHTSTFSITKTLAVLCVGIITVFALVFGTYAQNARAFEWGGRFGTTIPCFNAVIWTQVGPPRGGKFIWVPGATRTYDYGPPSSGKWGTGLAAPPYFCIVFPAPLVVFPGTIMTMLGTSN